jgi:hypothetical protein
MAAEGVGVFLDALDGLLVGAEFGQLVGAFVQASEGGEEGLGILFLGAEPDQDGAGDLAQVAEEGLAVDGVGGLGGGGGAGGARGEEGPVLDGLEVAGGLAGDALALLVVREGAGQHEAHHEEGPGEHDRGVGDLHETAQGFATPVQLGEHDELRGDDCGGTRHRLDQDGAVFHGASGLVDGLKTGSMGEPSWNGVCRSHESARMWSLWAGLGAAGVAERRLPAAISAAGPEARSVPEAGMVCLPHAGCQIRGPDFTAVRR